MSTNFVGNTQTQSEAIETYTPYDITSSRPRKMTIAFFANFGGIENVFSRVLECTLLCSAISGVQYSWFALLSHLIECVTIRVPVYIGIFCSLRSLDGISHYTTVNYG